MIARSAGRLGRLLCFVALCGALATAASPRTTLVEDTLYRADGTPSTGWVVITWPAFVTSEGAAVAAGSKSVQVGADGKLSVTLTPNSGSVPAGSFYSVTVKLDGMPTSKETWLVPAKDSATLAQVRAQTVPATMVVQALTAEWANANLAQVNAPNTFSQPQTVSDLISKTSPHVDVRAFGAKCDGTTDDTTAIAQAIASAATHGSPVLFPAATCVTGLQTIPDETPLTLQGANEGVSVVKLKAGANSSVIASSNFAAKSGSAATTGSFRLVIQNLTIDGNKASNTGSSACLAHYGHAPKFMNVQFRNCAGDGLYTEWGGPAAFWPDDKEDLEGKFENLKSMFNNGNGFVNRGPSDSNWHSITAYRNGGTGYRLESVAGRYSGNSHVHLINTYLNANGGLYLSGAMDGYNVMGDAGTATDTGCTIDNGGYFSGQLQCSGNIGLDVRGGGGMTGELELTSNNYTTVAAKIYSKVQLHWVSFSQTQGAGCVFELGANTQGSVLRGSGYAGANNAMLCGAGAGMTSLSLDLVNQQNSTAIKRWPFLTQMQVNGVNMNSPSGFAPSGAGTFAGMNMYNAGWFYAPQFLRGVATVAFSATPTFDLSQGDVQKITLTGDVTGGNVTNRMDGQMTTFQVCQDAAGNHAFNMNFGTHNGQAMPVAKTANTCTSQTFVGYGGWMYPVSAAEVETGDLITKSGSVPSTAGTPQAGKSACWKTPTTLGYCSSAVGADGSCTCN